MSETEASGASLCVLNEAAFAILAEDECVRATVRVWIQASIILPGSLQQSERPAHRNSQAWYRLMVYN